MSHAQHANATNVTTQSCLLQFHTRIDTSSFLFLLSCEEMYLHDVTLANRRLSASLFIIFFLFFFLRYKFCGRYLVNIRAVRIHGLVNFLALRSLLRGSVRQGRYVPPVFWREEGRSRHATRILDARGN